MPNDEVPPPSLLALFLACSKLSLTSFGGGVSAAMHVEFVVRRRWIAEARFMEALSLAQALPGVNVINLAVWLGLMLHGTSGAIVIVAAEAGLRSVAQFPSTAVVLAGIAVSALGLSLAMGLRAARHALRHRLAVVVFGLTLLGIALDLPLIVVVGGLAPLAIVLSHRSLGRGQR